MKCPRCGIDMRVVNLEDLEFAIDTCDQCEGIWFDQGELKSVIDYYWKDAGQSPLRKSLEGDIRKDETPGQNKFSCPRCGGKLNRFNYAMSTDVVVDACEKGCGIWVDDGELSLIMDHVITISESEEYTEQEKALIEKCKAIKSEGSARHARNLDSMCSLDNKGGLLGVLGLPLQAMYNILDRIGSYKTGR